LRSDEEAGFYTIWHAALAGIDPARTLGLFATT
jgi:hypothetical protein